MLKYAGRVRDIEKIEEQFGIELQLIQDSQDIQQVLKDIGYTEEENFGCLFVEVWEGEIGDVYGCYCSVPYNDREIFQIR